ncbi:hypothetical protein [Ciceribacter sp. RN22]|uniref:hypothetical protein n=1 Tax=Ciceribacter sp. RN22 TaxID=2954932 RepID=UPI002092883E|nr:hypothetical protein [Ciceribacter sp. RN22]MCO6180772.1 hypothetical protein [Ciceribacter sp. RN22]
MLTAVAPALLPALRNVSGFWGAFYASWLAGLLMFVATGLIIAAVTLPRPEQDLINTRIHNLLQRQQGPHIDYISKKLVSLLEPYMESVERTLHIVKYDEASKFFLVNQDTEIVYRSYVVDADVAFPSRVGYRNAPSPPVGGDSCCLAYLRVDGKDVGGSETFDSEIIRPFEISIKPHSQCVVKHRMVFWVAVGEPNRQLAIRFTRKMIVKISNQLGTQKVKVTHHGTGGPSGVIEGGEMSMIVNLSDVLPGKDENDFAVHFTMDIEN